MNSWLAVFVVAWGVVWSALPTSGAEPLVAPESLQQADYFAYWQAEFPLLQGDRVEAIYLLDDNLYLTTEQGELLAIHAEVGLLRWARRVTEREFRTFPPTHASGGEGGPVVVTHLSGISILDRYSGDLIKSIPVMFAPGGAAIANRTDYFAGGADGHFYAMRWAGLGESQPVRLWWVLTDGPTRATPAFLHENVLCFASRGGGVYCCTADRKRLLWQRRVDGTIPGEFDVDETGVYVATSDRSVYGIDRIDGRLNWQRRLPEVLYEGPVAAQGTVYQYCEGHGVFAIDATYGDVLWTCPEGRRFVARGQDEVCLITAGWRLAILDNGTGRVLRGFSVPRETLAAAQRDDATLYFASDDGRVLCAKPAGTPALRASDVAAAFAELEGKPRGRESQTAGPDVASGLATPSPEVDLDDPLRSHRNITPVSGH